jgi:hypothetical protein
MSEKEKLKTKEQEINPQTMHQKKLEKPYAPGNKKITPKPNEQESGPRRSRGKKQRRQFKLAPNRG